MRSKGLGLLAVGLLAGPMAANAAPIAIEYEFSPITVVFNGLLQSTGNFSMSIQTDTSNPNLGSGFGDFQNSYAADVFITAPTLGLNNNRVTNPTQLYFGSSVVGFKVDDFGTIITAFIGPVLAFGAPFDLSTLVVPQGPTTLFGTEFRTAVAITFDNGSFFDLGQFQALDGQTNTVRVVARDVAVPEPGSLALLGLGLAGLGLSRRRKSA